MHKPPHAAAVCSCSFRCLLACLVGHDEGVSRWLAAALQAGEDPVGLAIEHRLTPLLYQCLHDRRLLAQLPPGRRECLQEFNRRVMLRQARAYHQVHGALDLLRQAGVTGVLPLKGVALAASLWPDPLLRHMDDVDLLVTPEALSAAEQALLGAGFSRTPGRWSPTPWEYHLPVLEKSGVGVELHWRLWPPSPLQPFSLPALSDLLPRATAATLLERRLDVPALADQLLIMAAGMAHDGFSTRLRHWADVYWLAQRLTEDDWRQVGELATPMRLTGELALVLRFVEELTGLTTPLIGESAAAVEAVWPRLQPLLWRRLTEPRPLRASLWLRVACSGYRWPADWRDSLPLYLREQLPHSHRAVALQRMGGGLVATGKLLARLGSLAGSAAARRALREELLISKLLWGLAQAEGD